MSASPSTWRRISRVLVLVVVASGAGVGSRTASAQPSDATARAEALFREGKALMDAGKLAEACAAFERSQAVEARVTTVVNHANCREKNGQLATSARLFAETAEQLRAATDEGSLALRKLAADRVAALQPRLSRLTLRLTDGQPDGFELRRGAELAPYLQWNQPWPVDGGTYEVSATAPGHQRWVFTVTVRSEGDQQVVEVPALSPEAAAPDPLPATPSPARTSSAPRRSLALPIGLGLGAVVLGGVAIGIDLSAQGLNDDAQDLASGKTYAQRVDLWEDAKTRRYTAMGVGIAAAGCAGAAVFLYLRQRDRSETHPTVARTSIAPLLGGGAEGEGGVAGMQLRGSW